MKRYRLFCARFFARYGLFGALTVFGLALSMLTGCSPKIGSSCTQSTDCSVQGDRACDTSQVGGYCTIFGCTTNSCPDNAACVVFRVSLPGCPYNDYDAPARTARALCMQSCKYDSDCRDGYVCRDPRGAPWSAVIVDDTPQNVCIVTPTLFDAGDAGDDGAIPMVCSGTPFPASSADGESGGDVDAGVDSGDVAPDASALDAPGGG